MPCTGSCTRRHLAADLYWRSEPDWRLRSGRSTLRHLAWQIRHTSAQFTTVYSPTLMNVLILAAGYATRLYPLTSNKAKPLLDVAGKPMLEWVVENLRDVAEIETIYIVTNAKFFGDFETWAKNYQSANPQFRF